MHKQIYSCPIHGDSNLRVSKIGPNRLLECEKCFKKLAWVPYPMPLVMALEVEITFGKHAGKKLKDVPRQYLNWLNDSTERTDWCAEAVGVICEN